MAALAHVYRLSCEKRGGEKNCKPCYVLIEALILPTSSVLPPSPSLLFFPALLLTVWFLHSPMCCLAERGRIPNKSERSVSLPERFKICTCEILFAKMARLLGRELVVARVRRARRGHARSRWKPNAALVICPHADWLQVAEPSHAVCTPKRIKTVFFNYNKQIKCQCPFCPPLALLN